MNDMCTKKEVITELVDFGDGGGETGQSIYWFD